MRHETNLRTGETSEHQDAPPTPKSQADIDADFNREVDAELADMDMGSIRILLEWAATMPTAPQRLKDKKAAADTLRGTRKV